MHITVGSVFKVKRNVLILRPIEVPDKIVLFVRGKKNQVFSYKEFVKVLIQARKEIPLKKGRVEISYGKTWSVIYDEDHDITYGPYMSRELAETNLLEMLPGNYRIYPCIHTKLVYHDLGN